MYPERLVHKGCPAFRFGARIFLSSLKMVSKFRYSALELEGGPRTSSGATNEFDATKAFVQLAGAGTRDNHSECRATVSLRYNIKRWTAPRKDGLYEARPVLRIKHTVHCAFGYSGAGKKPR